MPAQKTLTACWGLTAGATPSALIDRHVLKRATWNVARDVRAKSVLLDGEGCIVAATLNAQGIGTLVQDGAIDAVPAAFGLLPRQLPPGTLLMVNLQETMSTGAMREGKLAINETSGGLRDLLAGSQLNRTVFVNLRALAGPGQGHGLMYSCSPGFEPGEGVVLAGLSDSPDHERVVQSGFDKPMPVRTFTSCLPGLRAAFPADGQRQILDPMFAGIIFPELNTVFLSCYEPTTSWRGGSELLELKWRIKIMAARATNLIVGGLRELGYTVFIGMDANSDLTARFDSVGAPGAMMQRAFGQLGLHSAWGSADQTTRGSRLIDFLISNQKAVAAGCTEPKELGLQSDHSLVWAVYRAPAAASSSKRQRVLGPADDSE